jgi:phospholipase C
VDHKTTDLSSILKFVQDNWDLPRIDGSFSNIAGSLNAMFDFQGGGQANRLILNPTTGQPTAKGGESGFS